MLAVSSPERGAPGSTLLDRPSARPEEKSSWLNPYLLLVLIAAGVSAGRLMAQAAQGASLTWIIARAMGITALICLTGLVSWGMWIRHPWRAGLSHLRPSTVSRVHVSLAVATLSAIVVHLVALALDPYAGVGWMGALLPFQSAYRTAAVSLGVFAFYALLVIAGSARLAGSRFGRSWRTIHRSAIWAFWIAWLHGVTTGTDSRALSLLYVLCGAFIASVWASKHFASWSKSLRGASS